MFQIPSSRSPSQPPVDQKPPTEITSRMPRVNLFCQQTPAQPAPLASLPRQSPDQLFHLQPCESEIFSGVNTKPSHPPRFQASSCPGFIDGMFGKRAEKQVTMPTEFWVILIATIWVQVHSEYIPPGPKYRCPKNSAQLYPCECTESGDRGVTVVCQNTNLASLSVGLKNLAREQLPVEKLNISKCSIARLYGNVLHTLKVRTLVFEETPVSDIADHFFLGVNKTLQELYLVNTSLQDYPTESFQILGNLTTLKIQGHNIQSLKGNAFSSSLMKNTLERLHITDGNITEISPDVFVGLKKLKTLDLHKNSLKELKRNQFKGLRDLELLDLSFNNLTKVDSSHMSDLNKLGWFNVSNNYIKELTRGTFARNTVLKYLNFNHNLIKKLDSNSFRGMRFIRRLLFSDNEISDVGRGTFGSVTRIGTIDLARNKLTKIDYQMFFQLNYVELIDVSQNLVTEIEKVAFKDLYLVKINVSHNAISKIEAGAFENCANITFLDLSHNEISEIPKTAFDSTTYATYLELSYNNLTSLGQIPLQNMTGLKVLNVSHNRLKTIPKNTFPKLYELHTIDVSHNEIKDIFNGVFQVLLGLRFLNLSHNNLESLKSSVFGSLPTLLQLDLSYNKLKDISRGALTRMASLRHLNVRNNSLHKVFQIPISLSELDLSHNKIDKISGSGETWPTMNSLLKLDLDHNLLEDNLEKGSFEGLLTLQRLNLSYNQISKPPWESLGDLSSLQYLDLQGNNITALQKSAFGRLPIVFELNLAHNNIGNVSQRAFEGLLQLLQLDLSHNNITFLPNGAFQGLVSLRNLDLSYNFLEKLDNKTHGLLDDCLSIEKVNLSHNKIAFVTRKMFPSSPYIPYHLRSVDLSYNSIPVITYDFTYGTKKLQVLNVSHNMVNEVRKGVLGNLTALKVLDLSHNDLTEFPNKYFGPPQNLTELYLSSNKLHRLPLKELLELQSKLRVADLRENNLGEFYPELLKLLNNGTTFKYSGNPLQCTCQARPLNRWIRNQIEIPEEWKEVKCFGPGYLDGQPLHNLTEPALVCPRDYYTHDEDYDVSPDVKFRQFEIVKPGVLSIQWFVNSKEDISDFYILLKQNSSQEEIPLYEKILPYNQRKEVITGKHIREFVAGPNSTIPKNLKEKLLKLRNFEVCLLTITSGGDLREWQTSQCRILQNFNLSSGSSKYSLNFYIFMFFITSLYIV